MTAEPRSRSEGRATRLDAPYRRSSSYRDPMGPGNNVRHVSETVCLIVLGSAVLLEIVQLLTPDRHGRIQDAIEKIAGGVVGIAVAQAILSFEQANRWFQN